MLRRLTPVLVLLLLAAATLGAGVVAAWAKDGKPPAAWVVLRGPQKPDQDAQATAAPAATPAPTAATATPAKRLSQLISPMPNAAPRYSWDGAQRIGGLQADSGQCRAGCAQTYYQCSATGSADDQCPQTWGQCVAACEGAGDSGS